MFAGKSTELIRRLRDARSAGSTTLTFKPDFDTRSGAAMLRTHTGDSWPSTSLATSGDVLRHIEAAAGSSPLAVGIDEAHFFGASLVGVVRTAVARGARVVVAGVERDHRGAPFEPFPALLCEADEVLKLVARCAVCGGEAVHSQRLAASDAPVYVGGAEAYEARCRACFTPGR